MYDLEKFIGQIEDDEEDKDTLEYLKKLYVNHDDGADSRTWVWSRYVFSTNVNGESFWSIGFEYMYELIKLLGNKEQYDKFSFEQIENLLDNDNEIQALLKTTSESEYVTLKEILTLKEPVKKALYDYMKGKLAMKKPTNFSDDNRNVEYTELTPNSFSAENGQYAARNVLFNNLKVDKVEILGDIEEGLKTLNNISEQYKDQDLKKICVEMLVSEDFSDWDENATTYEKCDKLLKGDVQMIYINGDEMKIWFNTTHDDAFGGHNPVLYLYTEIGRKSIEVE